MNIAVLSDVRLPTDIHYAGHGLGRSAARISAGLVKRGHKVTLYAGAGSKVDGCTVHIHSDENERAEELYRKGRNYDVYLDSTHFFRLAHLAGDWPVVCKICDMEGQAPRNRIYGTSAHARQRNDPRPRIIFEGLSIDDYPFNGGKRGDHLVFAGLLSAGWKRPDLAYEVAQKLDRTLWMVGSGGPLDFPCPQPGAIEPPRFYRVLGRATAIVSAVPTMSFLEGAACGTPSLGLVADEFIADGITGFARETVDKLADAARDGLATLTPARCREWVAAERSAERMCELWEAALVDAMSGKVW